MLFRCPNFKYRFCSNIQDLQESHEELQALLLTRSIQEGRSLLTDSNNLAAELEQMTQDDVSS